MQLVLSRTCPSCSAKTWQPPAMSEDLLATSLAIPQWGNVMDVRKGKEVYALHTKMFSVKEALELLRKQMEAMPAHLYKMATMYEALERAKANLKPGELLTLEDYQVQCAVCSAQCAVCSVQFAVLSVYCELNSMIAAKHRNPAMGHNNLCPHDGQCEAGDAVPRGRLHPAEGGRPPHHARLDLRQRRPLPRLPPGKDRRHLGC